MIPGKGTSVPSPPKPPAEAPSEDEPGFSEGEPLYLLQQFLWTPDQRERQKPPSSTSTGSPTTYDVRFLVATVPDPLDSHLAQSFDRAVDSIQRGVQESGYLLDSWAFPWKKNADPQWHLSFKSEIPPTGEWTATSRPAARELHRKTPGVLLFRGERPYQSKLLLVFLVGETPTTGVQREAFVQAFGAISQCDRFRKRVECDGGRIPLLAPYFSGSAASISESLVLVDTRGRDIQMVSGSATVPSNPEVLGNQPFHATVIPDDVLRKTFFEYLKQELGLEHRSVALFVEGSTSYGSAAAGRKYKKSEKNFPNETAGGSPIRFVLQFPLHVSQLRQAYEKDEALKSSGVLNRGPRRTLELPLETSESEPKDIVAIMDPRMASNVAELTLAAGIETIRREHVGLVGIIATDPRDVLFLARKIREATANVILFTFGSDILFAHPDYQRYLRGMLIVTPYPLYPANQRWTYPTSQRLTGAMKERVAFAGSTEEGIYNAVTVLLASDQGPWPRLRLMEYGAPDGTDRVRPPVWITAVGRGGFWPVAFRDYVDSDYVFPSPVISATIQDLQRWYWPPGSVLTLLLVDLFFAILLVFYLRARVLGVRGASFRVEELLGTWSEPLSQRLNRVYVVTLFGVALIIQTALLGWFVAAKPYLETDSILGLRLAAILLVTLAAIVIYELVAFTRDKRRGGAFMAPLAVLAAVSFFLVRYQVELRAMKIGDALTFGARALDLTSTLSPVVPFLLMMLVLFLWTMCNLQRAFLLEAEPPRRKSRSRLSSLRGVEELRADVLGCLSDPLTRFLLLAAPLVAVLPFFQTIRRDYWAIDGERWSHLMKCLLLSCHFVVVYSFAVFVLLWIRLKRFLRRLAVLPIVDAFRRLPEACAATPWKLWHAVPDLTTFAASVTQLRAVANLAESYVDAEFHRRLSRDAARADELLRGVLAQAPTGVAAIAARLRLRRALAVAVRRVLQGLEPVWQRWPAESNWRLPTWGSEDRNLGIPEWKRREVPSGEALWERAAEEFVALRESAFVRVIFLHLKNLLGFVFLGFVLMLAAISSYPFEPRHSVMALVWVVILTSIALIAWVFMEMDRDLILSYMGKTEPGKVTLSLEFLGTLAVYVGLPLLTLIATQFPGIGDVVYSIFNPAMRSLSH